MKDTPNFPRIYISRTEREWELIDALTPDINHFINKKLSELQKQYKSSPKSVCNSVTRRKQREYKVYPKFQPLLNILSARTGLPISTVVDRAVLETLILDKK